MTPQTNPDTTWLDTLLSDLIAGMPIIATEIGWEKIGEDIEDAKQAVIQHEAQLVEAAERDTLEKFRLFVFGRHYDGTWDGQGATVNGMIDTELRAFAESQSPQPLDEVQHIEDDVLNAIVTMENPTKSQSPQQKEGE